MNKSVELNFGHGGKDPGAVGNGLKEKDVVLDIGLKVGKILEAYKVKVTYTRTTDVYVELAEIARKANNNKVDIIVSLHINSATNVNARGVETFSHTNSTKGKALAKDIQDSLVDSKIFTSDRGIKTANFAVLRLTNMPAALVELGFISNKEDSEILKNKQNELAESVAKGILNFLGIKYIEDKKETEVKKSLYKVQVGAYSIKSNAEKLLKDLGLAGFKGYIKEELSEVEVVKKKNVTYKSHGGSTVIEVDPLDLFIDVVKSPGVGIKGDFINGSFYDMKSMKSISTLVSDGKVLAEHLPHDNVKRGTLIVYKNGTVAVEMIDFISKHPNLVNIKFAIGGFNILPAGKTIREQLKSEWFEFNTVGYRTWRSMLGYSKKANKVLIVITPNIDAEQGQILMQKIGCDIGIGLDSGGSTCGRFNNNTIRTTSRVIHNIIRW